MDLKYRIFVCVLLLISIETITYITQLKTVNKNFVNRLKILPLTSENNNSHLQLVNTSISKLVVRKQFKPLVENGVKPLLGNEFGDLNCSAKKVQASSHSLPLTALASFPGAGNTWSRHLIQQMSGLGTSSCYCDGSLKMKGFPFECHQDKSKTIVVKTHEYQHIARYKFNKVVLLIRNPYDALLAYASFAKAGHTGRPSKVVLIQAANKMFEGSMRWYINLTNRTILNYRGPVHILQYEQLKTNMSHTLQSLAKFLNVSITQRDIDCTVKLQEGNFHRKVSDAEHLQLLKEAYDKEKLLRMKEVAKKTEVLLKEAYGVDLDVGSPIERLLFDDS